MPIFPNVPNVPGVPALPRDPLSAGIAVALAVVDAVSFFFGGVGQRWGIFLDGFSVVAADSVVSLDFKQQSYVSDYPVEDGAFETYDKVLTPFDVRLRFSAGGSEANRQALLDSIAAIADTIDLYDVVTPEVVYLNTNVVHYDYKRTSTNGVGLLVVDVWLVEVRVTATAAFSNTKSPSAAGQVNGGTVQTSAATPTQARAVSDAEIAGGF